MFKGSNFTLQGLTVDSKLSNSMLAYLPYCMYAGLDDAAHMFWYAAECRKELRQLKRGVVRHLDPETGAETFYEFKLHGAGDGAHLRCDAALRRRRHGCLGTSRGRG